MASDVSFALMLSEPIMMNLPFFIYNQSGMFVLLQEITNWWYNSKQHIISKFSSQIAIVYLYHFCSLYTFSTGLYSFSGKCFCMCLRWSWKSTSEQLIRSIFHYFLVRYIISMEDASVYAFGGLENPLVSNSLEASSIIFNLIYNIDRKCFRWSLQRICMLSGTYSIGSTF